jgi:hypothetical protein
VTAIMVRTYVNWPRIGSLRLASPRGLRLCALCGLAGPVLFTAAWVVSLLRQTGHSAAEVQLSGLAAIDARDPQIMMAGFVALGVGSILFGAALGQLLAATPAGARPVNGAGVQPAVNARTWSAATAAPRPVTADTGPPAVGRVAPAGLGPAAGHRPAGAGPWLVVVAGAAAVAAGLLRRDHMLLVGPGFAGESWHNQAHDIVSGVAYTAMIAGPVALARRFRADPTWAVLRPAMLAVALASGMTLVLFSSRVLEPWNGVVQRIAVTLPLAAEVIAAAWMMAIARPGQAAGRG